jgi:prepilin-type N-terminal cleavage/methylation domain-containing protein
MNADGFTILEIIVTITIAAILGTIAIQFSSTSLSMSASTVNRIQKGYALNAAMEEVTRDYRVWLENSPGEPISEFETAVLAKYGAYVDTSKTGTDSSYYIDATEDVTIDLFHLTLTDGKQSLVTIFSK